MSVFIDYPLFFVFTSLLIGLLVGSFLNVVIYRLPVMMMNSWRKEAREILELPEPAEKAERFNLILPASTCPQCGHKITALENIPIVSYLFLKGRCKNCKSPISIRYPLIELLSCLLSGWIAWQIGFSIEALLLIFLTWGLIAMSMIDIDHQLLPDSLVLPLLWLGILAHVFGYFPTITLTESILGAVAGYLTLWIVNALFKLIRGMDGIGHGDFKLLALFGAWAGYQIIPVVILFSAAAGAIIGIIGILCFKGNNKIPFGPYLAIAGWIALLWGQQIVTAYLEFSGIN